MALGTAHTAEAPEDSGAAPLKRDLVAGLEKGLAVIEAFDQERPRLTISEVAAVTGLTRAAARRYLLTLSHLGFVTQDRKMFALTPKVLRLSQSYIHSARLPRIVEPELQKLAFQIKEASAAGVLDQQDVICIAATSGGRAVSPTPQAGTRVPAHATGVGRVLLSALSEASLDAWIGAHSLPSYTPNTITQPERLRAEINRARQQGYIVVDQELEIGLRTLAVPLKNYRGDIVAAANITTHASRMSCEQLVEHCLPHLLQAQSHLRMLL
ncbi:MAG TPA: IclR family transcriptional regulator C-terminal domain-containing protein [Burkholderiaceae bacterium]